ncbi:MAG: permease [Clostridia bacterium]|nr:permease [Clostridia bacterium]
MNLFGGVVSLTGVGFFMFCLFAVIFTGLALGRVKIKGIALGDAGVFVMALLFGAFFYPSLESQLSVKGAYNVTLAENALEIIETLGLCFFATSIGFIAGPNFIENMKKNCKSFVALGITLIFLGGMSAVLCIFIGRTIGFGGSIKEAEGFTAMISGLMSGALTSTPAFSAAKATVLEKYRSLVSVGYGIAYIYGVIAKVLFVQLIPKITKADMEEERRKIAINNLSNRKTDKNLLNLDKNGIGVFALAVFIGALVGRIRVPMSSEGLEGTCFSLTTTGGCMLTALVLSHFGRIGKLNLRPDANALRLFRELGLVFFLIGAGIPGGAEFSANFDPMYFVYGMIMTTLPLITGYLFAKYVLKMDMLNILGAITGGMTSTPALGTLMDVAGTEDVTYAYAATYPIALIAVVLVSQFIIILF